MKKLTRQEKHEQCIREIRGTLVVVAICCVWHISSAFLLNGTGLYFLGMPAWFSVSTLGTIVLSLLGVWYLLKKVFIDYEYEDEEEGGEESCPQITRTFLLFLLFFIIPLSHQGHLSGCHLTG